MSEFNFEELDIDETVNVKEEKKEYERTIDRVIDYLLAHCENDIKNLIGRNLLMYSFVTEQVRTGTTKTGKPYSFVRTIPIFFQLQNPKTKHIDRNIFLHQIEIDVCPEQSVFLKRANELEISTYPSQILFAFRFYSYDNKLRYRLMSTNDVTEKQKKIDEKLVEEYKNCKKYGALSLINSRLYMLETISDYVFDDSSSKEFLEKFDKL